jgi:alpha-N-arabinofuranosidase
LGGAVYDGLWANVVWNPGFGVDKQGRLSYWKLSSGALTIGGGDSPTTNLLLRSGTYATQGTNLPIHRQLRYHGSMWLQALGDQRATVEVSLRRRDKPTVIAAAKVVLRPEPLKQHRFSLIVPENALNPGEPCEIRIDCTSGSAEIGMPEIFPADAVDGVDPDVLQAAKELRIELLRWPGGNFVSGYHWRNGVGPRFGRPTLPNPAWGGLETHHFGTDEFMAFCRRIGAKPQICVNAGDGTPEEAAVWVEYCNGAADTPMGRLRAANGHKQPYNVRVWEIGNELYGDWQIGHTDPEGNAARFVRFRDAMLRADPTIEIIATGKGDEFTGAGIQRDAEWNEKLLESATAGGAAPPGYVSLHPLVPLPGPLGRRYSYDQIYLSVMAHPQWWSDIYVPSLQKQVTRQAGAKANVKAAVTEWGIIVGGPSWLRYPNHDMQAGAVYAGLFFNAMFRRADFVGLANVTALMHGGGIKRWNSVVFRDPMYHVEKMYGSARPQRLAPVEVRGPGFDVPERESLPGVSSVPWLDVVAAEGNGGRWLFVVNRDKDAKRKCRFALPAVARELEITTLAAEPQERNTREDPNRVHPVVTKLEAAGRTLEYTFAPCSVNVIRWR